MQNIIKKIRYELQFNNTNYYRRFTDKVLKSLYQYWLRKKVMSLKPIILNKANAKLTLATLANKNRFYESVAALYSFCFWEQNIHIHYHEDGTLDDYEIGLLNRIFPGITIFRRSEQNIKCGKLLAAKGLPNAAHLRANFLFTIKLVDMVVEKRTPYLLHIDSDVLFFSKPEEILEIVANDSHNGCFNQDVSNAYTFDAETLKKYVNVPMLPYFNSGLIMHNFDEAFFGFIDSVMKDEMHAIVSWHLEQTLLAMYASIKSDFLALPRTYDLLSKRRKVGQPIISEHYVHHTGHDFHKDFIYRLFPQYKN
ncbi:MAG: hypothetical protein ACXVAY_07170 [Mucilaginibacter sp.]